LLAVVPPPPLCPRFTFDHHHFAAKHQSVCMKIDPLPFSPAFLEWHEFYQRPSPTFDSTVLPSFFLHVPLASYWSDKWHNKKAPGHEALTAFMRWPPLTILAPQSPLVDAIQEANQSRDRAPILAPFSRCTLLTEDPLSVKVTHGGLFLTTFGTAKNRKIRLLAPS